MMKINEAQTKEKDMDTFSVIKNAVGYSEIESNRKAGNSLNIGKDLNSTYMNGNSKENTAEMGKNKEYS